MRTLSRRAIITALSLLDLAACGESEETPTPLSTPAAVGADTIYTVDVVGEPIVTLIARGPIAVWSWH